MPHYIEDPENPGKKIDVIELLKRNPDQPPPPDGILFHMRRDKWTRHEALLILAGYAPHNNVLNGLPVGLIGAGIAYLDGLTGAMLSEAGISHHPIHPQMLYDYTRLAGYASGEPMNERHTPVEWLAWAASKNFEPYWLSYWTHWLKKERAPVKYGRIESTGDVIKHVERCKKGRYQLREAAETFAENTGEQSHVMRDKLMAAVESGALRVYAPESEVSCLPETVRDFYEEAYWNDLNEWLASAEPRISWRFPEPVIALLVRKQKEKEAEHEAAGGFRAYVLKQETARIASEDRGYPVSPGNFTVREYASAEERLDAAASRKNTLAPLCVWADWFALELAVLNGQQEADDFHRHRFEKALLFSVRKGALRMRTLDPVGAPVEIGSDMRDDFVTRRLGVTTADLRGWAEQNWPELAQSPLLAEPKSEAATASQGRPDPEAERAQMPDGMGVWCLWSQAAHALASRQTIEDEAQAKRVLRRLGYYDIGDRRFPFPAPERSAESLAKFPDLKDVPRDGNARDKLLMHRKTEHERTLEQLHAEGKIKFYNPATLCRIRYGEALDPVVYMDEIAELIKSHHAERADSDASETGQEVERDTEDSDKAEQDAAPTINANADSDGQTPDEEIAALFDPVSVAELAAMFLAAKDDPDKSLKAWKSWARHVTPGLIAARVGRAMFNPYKAGLWWLRTKKPTGWTLGRLHKRLARNLPSRSLDEDTARLLSGEASD